MVEQAWIVSTSENNPGGASAGVGDYEHDFDCRPCREGCTMCMDDSPCFVANDVILRAVILSMQALCMLLTIGLIVVILRNRTAKVYPPTPPLHPPPPSPRPLIRSPFFLSFPLQSSVYPLYISLLPSFTYVPSIICIWLFVGQHIHVSLLKMLLPIPYTTTQHR